MAGTTAWVNVVVDGTSWSLPLYFNEGVLDVVEAGYFACPARASLSRAALASRSRAVGEIRTACGGGGDWLTRVPCLLSAAVTDTTARGLLARGWDFVNYLASARHLPSVLLDDLLAKAGTPVRGRSTRADNSFLCHLSPGRGQARDVRLAAPPSRVLRDPGDVPAKVPATCFPEKHIRDLFIAGLRHPPRGRGNRARDGAGRLVEDYDVRSLLYFLLLAFGSLRRSEPLHLFGTDIAFNFKSGRGAVVWLWHPERGVAPPRPDGSRRNRKDYLWEEFGTLPRTRWLGDARVGWKNLLLDEPVPGLGMRGRVQWMLPEIGMLFWRLNQVYVDLVRPKGADHPFHFVSLSNNSYGRPWTLDGAQSRFEASLEVLDLEPSAADGLCMHGWRHRAKRWMDQLCLSRSDKQQALHQNTLEAQEDYGRMGPVEVEAELASAARGARVPAVADAVQSACPEASEMDEIGRAIARHFAEAYLDLDR